MAGIYDPKAEQAVAACAAHSSVAALACTDRLTAEHFHDPRCWWIVQASLDVPDVLPDGVDAREGWWREHAVAVGAGVWPALLEEWCQQSPCAWDADGRMADRILAAAEQRKRAAALVVELEDIGVGVEWAVSA